MPQIQYLKSYPIPLFRNDKGTALVPKASCKCFWDSYRRRLGYWPFFCVPCQALASLGNLTLPSLFQSRGFFFRKRQKWIVTRRCWILVSDVEGVCQIYFPSPLVQTSVLHTSLHAEVRVIEFFLAVAYQIKARFRRQTFHEPNLIY